MAEKKRNTDVRFVRIRGRVVPIRQNKSGGGRRSSIIEQALGRKLVKPKSSASFTEKSGFRVSQAGVFTGSVGEVANVFLRKRLKAARSIQRSLTGPNSSGKPFNKIVKSSIKGIRFASKLRIAGGVIAAGGAALEIIGALNK